MLTVLKIKNLALVEDLTWEVGSGLVCVTGETGAGKSMIVGALKLILGERASRDLIRTGETGCSVEAVFELSNVEEVNELLEDAGLDACEDRVLVLKRVFGTSGANKQFVNCSPCTLTVLKNLGDILVDLHGPHDHQSLISRERQLAMLDAYGHSEEEREAYRECYRAWMAKSDELDDLRNAERATEQETDLLRFQVNEIESAELKPEEGPELEQRFKLAANSTRLVEAANSVLEHLSDEESGILAQMADMQRAIRDLERIDGQIATITSGFDNAQVELEELDSALRDYVDKLEIDPEEAAAIEARIDTLESLKRKYGNTLEDVIAFGEKAALKLSRIEGRGEELERLEAEVKAARKKVDEAAATLSAKRRKAAPRLGKDISRHLGDLGFKQSRFDLQLSPLETPGPRGLEEVDFLFAPNPGEPPKPLRVIASSGEMSRVMLAVKSALAQQDQIPLMVFDEIDANVGGEIAHAVGAKMAALGDQHQVLSITHLPQVAAAAHCHYVVSKEFGKGSTRSLLRQVEGESRVAEISRMLGGGGKSAEALAETLLAGVR